MARPRVLLVGAYERDNFGDLLFLLVTERYLEGAEVVAAAPFSADMRALLDRRIPAYGPLLRDEAFDAIWTVGGQVGRVDLRRAYRMSAGADARGAGSSASPEPAPRDLLRRGGRRRPARLAVHPAAVRLPAQRGRRDGAQLRRHRRRPRPRVARACEPLVAALRSATSIAVRDGGSSRFLTDLGVEHRLGPDAVHALGVLDPRERDAAADVAIVQVSSAAAADARPRARWAQRSPTASQLARAAGPAAARRDGARPRRGRRLRLRRARRPALRPRDRHRDPRRTPPARSRRPHPPRAGRDRHVAARADRRRRLRRAAASASPSSSRPATRSCGIGTCRST